MSTGAPRVGGPPTLLLVGAGPGDPDLLTLDAASALASATSIVADRSLVALLDALAGEGGLGPAASVEWVDDDRPAPAALVELAARPPAEAGGVVRLYRGDPWAHPAGDVERAALRAAGQAFALVPGVLAEVAAATAAGIPTQVRTASVATTFVVDGASPSLARLAPPVDPAHTLVVRAADLAGTAARLAQAAAADGTDDRPVALVPVATGAVAVAAPTRTTLRALGAGGAGGAVAGGPGIVVVGVVAALDLATPGSPR